MAVETCQMIAKIEGRPVVAMLDDGSEINIMPLELWNKLNKEKLLSLCTDVIFNVFGIHGSGEAMLGQTQVAVEFSGVTTHHNFVLGCMGSFQGDFRYALHLENRVDI